VPTPVPTPTPVSGLSLRVVGNHFVNGSGQTMRLLGVNRSGTEYMCINNYGIFDGPNDDASVAAIASWHANAVRVPLNEDCWLGINGSPAAFSGANYRNAIVNYVNLLHRHNLYVILDLHWTAAGGVLPIAQTPMADADHAPTFWVSLASTFKNDPAVVFDLYNEPFGISWDCWLNGCNSPGYQTAGMQSLVNAVRSTGATQPLMLGGLDWSDDLSQWLAFKPSDPQNQLVASYHSYLMNPQCALACWNSVLAPVAQRVPIVTGELGQEDCGTAFINQYMAWADGHGVSYTAWVWDTWGCGGYALITDYAGTPTAYGAGYRAHLMTVN
jgi:Cellulase (glycosyl hydrolase family 5)